MLGAFFFGWLTDRWAEKKLFTITLGVYLVATGGQRLSWNAGSYVMFRCLTGAGIGREVAAINSAIQELIPARFRGRTDLADQRQLLDRSGSLGAGGSLVLLDPAVIDPADG